VNQNTLDDAMYRRETDFSFITDDIEGDLDDETLSGNHSESLCTSHTCPQIVFLRLTDASSAPGH
jgi:hypothetical protein